MHLSPSFLIGFALGLGLSTLVLWTDLREQAAGTLPSPFEAGETR